MTTDLRSPDLCEVGQIHDGTDLAVFNAPTVLDPDDEYLPRARSRAFAARLASECGCRWAEFDCTYSEYITNPHNDEA